MIAEYSPNTSWGKQRVEVTFMQWKYKATLSAEIGGNCTGFTVMESAIARIYEDLPALDEAMLILTDDEGNTLQCEDEEGRGEDWLRDMVVSAQIVDWKPPTLNEVREMNGAKPVPDGDVPWRPL